MQEPVPGRGSTFGNDRCPVWSQGGSPQQGAVCVSETGWQELGQPCELWAASTPSPLDLAPELWGAMRFLNRGEHLKAPETRKHQIQS